MSLLQRATITRLRAERTGEDDEHGNPRTAAPVATPIPRCSVQPGAAPEVLGNRDTTGIAWTVFVHGSADIVSTDRIRLPGDARVYDIDGEPLRWGGTIALPGQTVLLLKAWQES